MKTTFSLIKRNVKMFFKDKVMFFTSLITPLILLVLYATFLAKVFKTSIKDNFNGAPISNKALNALVGGQLVSSLMSIICITVSFCSNMLMVQDKANGTIKDFNVSSVSQNKLSIAYFAASFIATLIICYVALALSFVYLIIMGWYLTFTDVILLILDTFLSVAFGTALSSVIHSFLSTQGQISTVGTIVSAGYGFICGAYMPIASFSTVLQKILIFLPSTYATNLFRIHSVTSTLKSLDGVPQQAITSLKQGLDIQLSFFGNTVSPVASFIVLITSTIVLIGVFLLINLLKNKKKK